MSDEEKFRICCFDLDKSLYLKQLYFGLGCIVLFCVIPTILSLIAFGFQKIFFLDKDFPHLTLLFLISWVAYIYYNLNLTTKIYLGKHGIEIYPINFRILYSEIGAIKTPDDSIWPDIILTTKESKWKVTPLTACWTGETLTIRGHGLHKDAFLSAFRYYWQAQQSNKIASI